MLILAAGLALAASRVDPGLEAPGVEAAYRAWAESQGRTGDALELVCRPFVEPVHLCFSREEEGKRKLYTKADGRTLVQLEAAAKSVPAATAVARLQPVTLSGFKDPYWVASEADGRDHAPLLYPDAVKAKVGGDFVAAAPTRGTLVVWKPGDLVFDTIVAVGVRRMYETLPNPVSPLLFRWTGTEWVVWGEARAVEGAPDPTPIPSVPSPARPPG